MKSKRSATTNLSWDSSSLELSSSKKKPKNLQKLFDTGFKTIKDLLSIIPLRIQAIPPTAPFHEMKLDHLFQGQGHVISKSINPAYNRRFKKGPLLHNISLMVQDIHSEEILTLTWFNCYPNLKSEIENLDYVDFMGIVKGYKSQKQIITPKLAHTDEKVLIEYPTVSGISGSHIKKIIQKIPLYLWEKEIQNTIELDIYLKLNRKTLTTVYKNLHGFEAYMDFDEAKDHLIYNEFFHTELKVNARKERNKKKQSHKLSVKDSTLESFIKRFPYTLTPDQTSALKEIRLDLASEFACTRILQGDVGCGKTSIAILAALITLKNDFQVAIMCPTEALARQHFETVKSLIDDFKIGLLLGSSTQTQKKNITEMISDNEINLIIGTHSLIQEKVTFANLGLAIIDEQHKFGVKQRLDLSSKAPLANTLLMSATPIPRTLQLAQFGDLDISTIKTMPKGRKGTQTRIVEKQNFVNFLNFVKTRLSLKEQIYIVAPAIEESETMELENVQDILNFYTTQFPENTIASLHGRLTPQEKEKILHLYGQEKIDILVSTTVIEVGINNINSTVMAVYGPERFGLSSLHQLRGRVGRGSKPGFFFLVSRSKISPDSMKRLKVIEQSNDGFQIAEADLKIRGQGDLFGQDQSGHGVRFKHANIVLHSSIYKKTHQEIQNLRKSDPELLNLLEDHLTREDQKVLSTI